MALTMRHDYLHWEIYVLLCMDFLCDIYSLLWPLDGDLSVFMRRLTLTTSYYDACMFLYGD